MSKSPCRSAGNQFSLRHELGATAVEYALMVALIAVVIMGAVELLGDRLSTGFAEVSTTIGNSPASSNGGGAGAGSGGGGGGGGGGNGANNNGQGGGWGGGVGGGQGHN